MNDKPNYVKEKIKNDSVFDLSTWEKQKERAFLRERFLRIITGVVGNQLKKANLCYVNI